MNRIVSDTEREKEREHRKKFWDKSCQLAKTSKEIFNSTRLQRPQAATYANFNR